MQFSRSVSASPMPTNPQISANSVPVFPAHGTGNSPPLNRKFCQIVCHQRNVSGLKGNVRASRPHRNRSTWWFRPAKRCSIWQHHACARRSARVCSRPTSLPCAGCTTSSLSRRPRSPRGSQFPKAGPWTALATCPPSSPRAANGSSSDVSHGSAKRRLFPRMRRSFEQLRPGPEDAWLAQERICGLEASFQVVAHRGRLVGFTAYSSNWRVAGGASYAFEPLEARRTAPLRELGASLAKGLELHGQFGCDAIFDGKGRPYLIQCNPRATSGVHLLVGDGALACAIGDGRAMADRVAVPAHLAPAMLVFGLPRAIRAGRLGEWCRSFASGSDALTRR